MKMPTKERAALVNNIVREGRGAFTREELHECPTEQLQ
jgi:hypothetical protein